MPDFLKTTAARIIGAVVILLAVVLILSQCTSLLSAGKEAKVAKGQAGASINSGAEATNTLSNVMAADDETDAAVKGGRDEILKAPPGRSNDAALRALCRLRQYRDQQRCAELRRAGPGGAPAGRPPG